METDDVDDFLYGDSSDSKSHSQSQSQTTAKELTEVKNNGQSDVIDQDIFASTDNGNDDESDESDIDIILDEKDAKDVPVEEPSKPIIGEPEQRGRTQSPAVQQPVIASNAGTPTVDSPKPTTTTGPPQAYLAKDGSRIRIGQSPAPSVPGRPTSPSITPTTSSIPPPDVAGDRSVYDIDIDDIPDKPWKAPGATTSDYFNYGFDEKSWKEYVKKIKATKEEREKERSNPFTVFAKKPLEDAWSSLSQDSKASMMQVIMSSFAQGGFNPMMQGGPNMIPPGMQGMPAMMTTGMKRPRQDDGGDFGNPSGGDGSRSGSFQPQMGGPPNQGGMQGFPMNMNMFNGQDMQQMGMNPNMPGFSMGGDMQGMTSNVSGRVPGGARPQQQQMARGNANFGPMSGGTTFGNPTANRNAPMGRGRGSKSETS